MLLYDFAARHQSNSSKAKEHPESIELEGFFNSIHGQTWRTLSVLDFDARYKAFKDDVAAYARGGALNLDRMRELYLAVHKMVSALNDAGYTKASYDLDKCFLSDAEVDLLILKLLHEAKAQEKLAEELGISRQAISKRIAKLKDGMCLGDFKAKIEPAYGGKLESTVHPVLLPLNLSEVFSLLKTLGAAAGNLDAHDPHRQLLRDLAEKVYYQLSDYARGRIDAPLADAGVRLHGSVPPSFDPDTRASSRHATPIYTWVYYEKAGVLVRVLCGGENGTHAEHVGYLRTSKDVTDLLGPDDPRNPARCFALQRQDGSYEVIGWPDVLDIVPARESNNR